MYFFLLVLKIPFDLGLDVSHKQGEFSKTLLKEGFKFVLSKGDGIIAFNLSFVLLPAEVNPVFEKQSRKKDAFVVYGSDCIKIILTLLTEVIAFYMQASIIKIAVVGLKTVIARCNIYLKLAIFLAFDKQFQDQFDGFLQVFVYVSPWRA